MKIFKCQIDVNNKNIILWNIISLEEAIVGLKFLLPPGNPFGCYSNFRITGIGFNTKEVLYVSDKQTDWWNYEIVSSDLYKDKVFNIELVYN